jgi:hypothetical protein
VRSVEAQGLLEEHYGGLHQSLQTDTNTKRNKRMKKEGKQPVVALGNPELTDTRAVKTMR